MTAAEMGPLQEWMRWENLDIQSGELSIKRDSRRTKSYEPLAQNSRTPSQLDLHIRVAGT